MDVNTTLCGAEHQLLDAAKEVKRVWTRGFDPTRIVLYDETGHGLNAIGVAMRSLFSAIAAATLKAEEQADG